MVLKLKSRTVLRPLIFTRPLASRGMSECLSNVLTRSNLFLETPLQWRTTLLTDCNWFNLIYNWSKNVERTANHRRFCSFRLRRIVTFT